MNAGDQALLLQLARRSMENVLRGQPAPVCDPSPALLESKAAFVTLKQAGELRGCIGEMDFDRPLWENVVGAAAAALRDPRFAPVTAGELPELRVEISVLERPVELPRVEDFDARRQGIIVQRGMRRALLLPKVAEEYGWTEEQVLRCVCEKAGLPAGAWREAGTRFQVFTAVDFGED